jgi:hypothetical protein
MALNSPSIPQSIQNYTNKGLPPVPHGSPHGSRVRNMREGESKRSSGSSRKHRIAGEYLEGGSPQAKGQSLHSKSSSPSKSNPQGLPPPPKPPMTKSATKILQLTGHDVRHDRALQEEHSEFLDDSSSGSAYSQPEDGGPWRQTAKTPPSKTSAPQLPGEIDASYLQPTSYHASDEIQAPAKSTRPALEQIQPAVRTYSTEPITLKSFIRETQSDTHHRGRKSPQYGHRTSDLQSSNLRPAPLNVPSKSELKIASEPQSAESRRRSSILSNARESFALGVKELQGPVIRSKEPAIPEDVVTESPSTPQEQVPRKRNFGRISNPWKRISGASVSPTKTTNIISNAARAPEGPDTPVVRRSDHFPNIDISETAHHKNEHFQEVYERAKKSLRIKSSDEKRREELKKKIVVVGITDQSPGMHPF